MASNKEKQKRLQEAAASMLPDPTIMMSLIEHEIDLIGHLVVKLAERVDLEEEDKALVESLKDILEYASVDFKNLESPLESYKFPKVKEGKERTRVVQQQYLQAQIREGIFDD